MCQNDWWELHGDNAVDHFGRLKEAKHLTEQNAWRKRYRWEYERNNGESEHYYLNTITREQRSLTKQQYDDTNYTLNER